MKDAHIVIGIIVCSSLIGFLIGEQHGKDIGIRLTQRDAVESGHAEWLTTEGGTEVFHWRAVR